MPPIERRSLAVVGIGENFRIVSAGSPSERGGVKGAERQRGRPSLPDHLALFAPREPPGLHRHRPEVGPAFGISLDVGRLGGVPASALLPPSRNTSRQFATVMSDTPARRPASARLTSPRTTDRTVRSLSSVLFVGVPPTPASAALSAPDPWMRSARSRQQ